MIRTARSGLAGSGSDTEAGSLLGTPAYMPPEQARGDVADLDRRADVFGLGAILCEILTGKPPYIGRSDEEVRRKAANGDLADARARLADCGADEELIALTAECLSPEAIDRPRDAQAVTNALTAYLDGVQDRLRRAEVDRASAEARAAEEVNTRRMAEARAAEERRRRRAQAGLAAAVLALVGLASGGAWYQQRQRAATQAERASRRAATAASIAESLVDARRRMAEAWAAASVPDRMDAATEAAEAAVRRAEDYAASGEPTEASRAELAAIRAPMAELVRHNRLAVDYEWIEDRIGDWDMEPSDHCYIETAISRFDAALRRFGLEPLEGPEERTAGAIAADPLRDTLIAILSRWQFLAAAHDHTRVIERLGRVIRVTRLRCGGSHARWQGLLDRKDWKGLAAFAASPEWLELGPHLVEALALDLQETAQDHEAVRGLLRAAVDRYPHAVALRLYLSRNLKYRMNPPGNLESLQQIAAVSALKPDSIMPPTILAETYMALGDYEQTIALHRKAAERGSSVSACEMGEVYWYQLGDLDAAIAAYRQALTMPNTTHAGRIWKPRAEKNLARALVLKPLEVRLPRLLGGEDRPGSAAEALDIAEVCRYKRDWEGMARSYAIAFALEPKLADDVEAWHRYNAACAAAMAAAGQGVDSARLDEAARVKLRRQSLSWLRDDLAEWTRRLGGGQVSDRSKMRNDLALWLRDGDLAGVRDADALATLPAEERAAWAKLWADFEALMRKAQEAPK